MSSNIPTPIPPAPSKKQGEMEKQRWQDDGGDVLPRSHDPDTSEQEAQARPATSPPRKRPRSKA